MVKNVVVIKFSRCIGVHFISFITRCGKKGLQHFYGYLSQPLNARSVTWPCWILGCGGGRSPLLWQAPDHISARLMSSCTKEPHHKRYIPPRPDWFSLSLFRYSKWCGNLEKLGAHVRIPNYVKSNNKSESVCEAVATSGLPYNTTIIPC